MKKLREKIRIATMHLNAEDQIYLLSIIDNHEEKSGNIYQHAAITRAKACFNISTVVFIYKTDYNKVRIRISERLFDPNGEIFLGRCETMDEVKAVLCKL